MSSSAPGPTRRSLRRTAAQSQTQVPTPTIRGLPITAFRRPWVQHYIDIGHCRLSKCTKRIQEAKTSDISYIRVSFLAMAIKASSAYGPKWRQDQALVKYAQAVIERGIPPNDHDNRLGSAVAMAAYFGYPRLLRLLLDTGCPLDDGDPHAIQAAVQNHQHECIRLLLQERPEQVRARLHQETLASWKIPKPTTLKLAICAGDVEAARLLKPHGAKVLILFHYNMEKKWTNILKELYPNQNILAWSRQLHWTFPAADRRMLNWLWHALKKQQQASSSQTLPSEVWRRVFGFIGRGWWSLSVLRDQNGWETLRPSMLH